MGARSSRNTTQNNRSDGHLLEYFRNTFVRGGGALPPRPGLIATGGTLVAPNPGGYEIRHFPTPGSFIVSSGSDTTSSILVVGGGGGGSFGGGGGGGVAYSSAYSLTVATYGITIGSGNPGANGGNTTFVDPVAPRTIQGTGGGRGGGESPSPVGNTNVGPGAIGGSGGAGGHASPLPAAGASENQSSQPTFGGLVTNYGNPGGDGSPTGPVCCEGGGGGGAGGAGTNSFQVPGDGNGGGNGGIGIGPPTIPWMPVSLGQSGYFAGGGGGSYTPPGGGGLGGGGTGSLDPSNATPGTNGTANTGGGGGGTNAQLRSGGSGIVIVRYLAR
jgi:hypothetical protein